MKLTKYTLLTAISIFLLNACTEKEEKKKEVLRPVKFEMIGHSSAASIRTFSGVAKAGNEIELSFRTNGIITKINAKIGQKVKKDDLIAKLDNVQAKLAFEQAVSALKSAKSAMNTSKSSLDRVRSMYEKGSSSLSEYEAAKNSFQSLLGQYDSAKKSKEIQQSQINYGYINAPSDGVIALVNSDLNENISAGQVVAVLNAGDQTNIVVGMPENVINKVILGMSVDLKFSALDGQERKGSVIEVAPIVDANSATYPVKIVINGATEMIKPGMTASVTFDFSSGSEEPIDNSLMVPVKAVGEDGNGNFVFVVISSDGKTGHVKKQTVEIGALTSNGFIIKSGLSSGDKIATAGLQTLLDGQKVKLQ